MRLMWCHIGAGDPEYQIPFYLYDCNKVILLGTANLSNSTIKTVTFWRNVYLYRWTHANWSICDYKRLINDWYIIFIVDESAPWIFLIRCAGIPWNMHCGHINPCVSLALKGLSIADINSIECTMNIPNQVCRYTMKYALRTYKSMRFSSVKGLSIADINSIDINHGFYSILLNLMPRLGLDGYLKKYTWCMAFAKYNFYHYSFSQQFNQQHR